MDKESNEIPLVSFCMSTYKRPELLKQQLLLLLKQDYKYFDIVISDNDSELSAKKIVMEINDSRIRYFANDVNLGMVNSFNKSIERATTKYIVMITDDDPLDTTMLMEMVELIKYYPDFSIYCGFKRQGKKNGEIETFSKDNFAIEMLDPRKTFHIFWTNCILNRHDTLKSGGMPEYGSPHLADHAMMAFTGSINGGVIINKTFSTHCVHDSNFSRLKLDNYLNGCTGFYECTKKFFANYEKQNKISKTIIKHLHKWFIVMSFSLRRFYFNINDNDKIAEIDEFSKNIIKIEYMKTIEYKYRIKKIVFRLKNAFGII